MKEVDYIVVGCGLAGISFCEVLKSHNKSFLVFEDSSQQSSSVAAGMYNPVILKRFTPVWKASEQLDISIPMYQRLEKDFDLKIDYQFPLYRRFASIEEQNLWFSAADKPKLSRFLSLDLIENSYEEVEAPHGYGVVNEAGRVHTALLVKTYRRQLLKQKLLIQESFQYLDLEHSENGISYHDIRARHVVFCEGFGVKQNPFFRHIPINGTKGEVLTVRIKGFELKQPIKSSVFIIPLGKDLFRVGATYSHKDKSNEPTEEGKQELLDKLKAFIKVPVELVDHKAGVRPTVIDRRPLVGRHPEYSNLYVLNGLGSRGVMIGPYVSEQLFWLIERGQALDQDIDLTRFEH